MKLWNTRKGLFLTVDRQVFPIPESGLDALLRIDDLPAYLDRIVREGGVAEEFVAEDLLAPIESQEVWAAGVTYYRSRDARMEESREAGGGSFYDRVYTAERPELFFKATPSRVVGPGQPVRIRRDAHWSVPEPEWTLLIDPRGRIVGCTIGNDMSSRDIEGENPLYLPQAKVYQGSCALGPAILLTTDPLPTTTTIEVAVERGEATVFSGSTTLAELRRSPESLVEYLFRDNLFPYGVFLMTGTGIVPADDFTLLAGDLVRIRIEGLGELANPVVCG